MKQILNIVHNEKDSNETFDYFFNGEVYNIIKCTTGKNINLLLDLLKNFEGKVDAVALSGLPPQFLLHNKNALSKDLKLILNNHKSTVMNDGHLFRQVIWEWILRENIKNKGEFLYGKTIGFFCGLLQKSILSVFEEAGAKCILADPYFLMKTPLLLKNETQLNAYLLCTKKFFENKPIHSFKKVPFIKKELEKNFLLQKFTECEAYVCQSSQFEMIHTDLFIGKTIITDCMDSEMEQSLLKKGVQKIIKMDQFLEHQQSVKFSIIEACLQSQKSESTLLKKVEINQWIKENKFKPFDIEIPFPKNNVNIFSFLIHPLSKKHLSTATKIKNQKAIEIIESLTPKAPAFEYCKITGIESRLTHVKAEGIIYLTPETPKMLLKCDPDSFYEKVLAVSRTAHKRGAKLLGLGAYTKIVGDGGVTIASKSKIPVTTGNSLSSASTLWAADFGVRQMNLVALKDDFFLGTVMIVGATGSIGKVTSKLLSHRWKKVILIAPNIEKLKELLHEIKNDPLFTKNHDVEMIISTQSDEYIDEADLIITTTSNQSGSVIDILKVKPGAVICDVSRPFDIKEEDAALRPDVLVIASGEIELPGNVKVTKNIGLHGSVVYACLAETAILALEGRYESFSLSRQLDPLKVAEIDKLARKHGAKLAAIMGHSSEITVEDIQNCREIALKNLEHFKHLPKPIVQPGLKTKRSPSKKVKKNEK